MASQPPATPASRWSTSAGVIVGMVGLSITIIGLLIAIGKWQGDTDSHLANLDRRMDQAEANQRTYIPILVGMTHDLQYLADRARREDDERARGRR